MYEDHFGLAQNPFQPVAEGEAIFEGPEQAKVIADLKIALTARDSVAVLTGPVGVGKTTIVTRALEEMGSERLVARLGRTQVGSDELVDLLLAKFGVAGESSRRFECLKTFNRILSEQAALGARVFIVIEDAERLVANLLEELEALTATDDGASAGANIILMGPQKLDKLIAAPALERVRQRIRLQQALERFTSEQVEDYLHHRITAAGGDFDAMFEEGTALMVRRCSGGIPRVINALCETALTVAAETQVTQVTPQTIFDVAVEVFGMEPGKVPPAPVAKPKQAAKPKPTPKTSTEPAGPVQNMPAAPEAKPRPQQTATPAAPEPSPPAAAAVKPASHKPTPAPKFKFADDIVVDKDTQTNLRLESELKQVTVPELPALKLKDSIPKIADEAPKTEQAPVPPPAAANDIATPGESSRVEKPAPAAAKPVPAAARPAPAAASVPASSKAPSPPAKPAEPEDDLEATACFAKVDHDMLDAALADLAVHDDEDAPEPASETPGDSDKQAGGIPEMTLDKNLAAGRPATKVETAPAIPKQVAAEMDKYKAARKPAAKKETEPTALDKLAAEAQKAESLEDVSDQLAETLFGCEELEAISLKIREKAQQKRLDAKARANARVAAQSPTAKPTPEVPQGNAKPETPSVPEPPAAAKPAAPQKPVAAVEKPLELAVEKPEPQKPVAAVEKPLELALEKPEPQKPVAAVGTPVEPAAEKPVPPKPAPGPEAIEDQFSKSMTKTLQDLGANASPPSDDQDTEETDTQAFRAGLLGRLKESFKS